MQKQIQHQRFSQFSFMNQQFQCTKIKDGLYLGNIVAAHDYQFLLSNKFGFVVNCTAQIPNVFQHENIRYLKFKLIENKPHKLWDQTLKKLNKLEKFLEEAQQTSLCCLIHSFHGQNRSLVFIAGYLMKKYQWRLKKCLEFLKSKQIFIGLSNHYISQLEILEQILMKNSVLSSAWTPPYINQEEEIISKTFINSLQGKQTKIELGNSRKSQKQQVEVKVKKERRVVWLDKLQKKKKKEQISQKKAEQLAKLKQKAATHIETVKYRVPQYDMRDSQLIKNIEFNSNKRLNSSQSIKPKEQIKKQKNVITFEEVKQDTNPSEKNIYQLTINNFISPNFNIINKTQGMVKKPRKKDEQKSKKQDKEKKEQKSQKISQKQKKVRPTSAKKKSTQKINRAQSQKEVATIKGLKQIKQYQQTVQKQQVKQIKEVKQKKSNLGTKERDIKKQLKKEIQKVQKEKSSHSSLHLLHPLSTLAQQLIKTQQGNIKRSSTPTRKQRKKQATR